ncbi:MAG TPA: methyltransferase domain-containing protein [Dermatophilaceae bacterium]|nr:methyltransferase domain-containing protein [Dermatophilaceae bacterium]
MTTTQTPDPGLYDPALAARLRALWALGDYAAVHTQVIPTLGATLVEACGVGTGDRVLDVAAGSGNAAIPAALAGADVVAADLTPELLDAGRRLAAERGAALEWREADAERLPFEDDAFDVVLSCVGVMFAPHHQRSADELLRVCRPAGTVGLLSWTPEGFVGELFGVLKPYAAPPPPGARPAPLWGAESHVRGLLGERVEDLRAERRLLVVDRFERPEDFTAFFRANYGPTVGTYARVADDPDQVAALDHGITDLARRHLRVEGGRGVMEWEYLLVTARRR